MRASMAVTTVRWSDLPVDILSILAKLLNSDIDLLRLRSVCTSWRCSLPPTNRPLDFPLKLPLLPDHSEFGNCGAFTLNQITVYSLSPPAVGATAADPSNGCLVRVLPINPNRFSILATMTTVGYFPGFKPNHLNLLDYRISEISKSYAVRFVNRISRISVDMMQGIIKKVIGLWNFVSDCDFAALILLCDGGLSYWKLGGEDWIPVDTKGCKFDDVILCDGKCYAVDKAGVLVSFDSELNLTKVVASPVGFHGVVQNYLVESESELYLVSKIHPQELRLYFQYLGKGTYHYDYGLVLRQLNKCNDEWDHIGDLGDKAFVLCDDSSLSVCAKDFVHCKGNSVYLKDRCFVDESNPSEMAGFYGMDGRREFIFTVKDFGEIWLA